MEAQSYFNKISTEDEQIESDVYQYSRNLTRGTNQDFLLNISKKDPSVRK